MHVILASRLNRYELFINSTYPLGFSDSVERFVHNLLGHQFGLTRTPPRVRRIACHE